MSSLLNVGLGVGFVPGAMFDRFGPQWTSLAGLFISVPAYLLLWSTTKSVGFYSRNSWLMSVYFFFIGFGSVFTYMVALNTNLINFDKKHAGKIVGLLNAFFAGSPSIFSVIYFNLFTHGDSTNTDNQDFPGFMMMFAVCFAAADILCIAFVKLQGEQPAEILPEIFPKPSTPTSASSLAINATEKSYESTEEEKQESINAGDKSVSSRNDRPMSFKQILLNVDYQLIMWFISFSSCIGLVFVNNITAISKAMHLDRFDNRLTIIIPITNAIVSASIGVFADFFQEKIPKMWILICSSICFTLSQVLVLAYADKIAVLVIATIVVGIGIGTLWSISPALIQEMFCRENIGRNWGIAFLVASLLGFCNQAIFGAFYDHAITTPGDTHCYGMKCIRGGTITCIAFGGISLLIGVTFQIKRSLYTRKLRNTGYVQSIN